MSSIEFLECGVNDSGGKIDEIVAAKALYLICYAKSLGDCLALFDILVLQKAQQF